MHIGPNSLPTTMPTNQGNNANPQPPMQFPHPASFVINNGQDPYQMGMQMTGKGKHCRKIISTNFCNIGFAASVNDFCALVGMSINV